MTKVLEIINNNSWDKKNCCKKASHCAKAKKMHINDLKSSFIGTENIFFHTAELIEGVNTCTKSKNFTRTIKIDKPITNALQTMAIP